MSENKELTREEAEKCLRTIKENMEVLANGHWGITIGMNVTDRKINEQFRIPASYRDLVITGERQDTLVVK